MVQRVHSDCTSCESFKRLIWFDDNGVAQIERFCTYHEKDLTKEEIAKACDAYEEVWE